MRAQSHYSNHLQELQRRRVLVSCSVTVFTLPDNVNSIYSSKLCNSCIDWKKSNFGTGHDYLNYHCLLNSVLTCMSLNLRTEISKNLQMLVSEVCTLKSDQFSIFCEKSVDETWEDDTTDDMKLSTLKQTKTKRIDNEWEDDLIEEYLLPEFTVDNKEDTAIIMASNLELGLKNIILCINPPPHMAPTWKIQISIKYLSWTRIAKFQIILYPRKMLMPIMRGE